MDDKLLCPSDNESTRSSESNPASTVTAPPPSPPPSPITRFRCSYCSKTFSTFFLSSEHQLLNHQNKASCPTAALAEIFKKIATENANFLPSPPTPLPTAIPATSNNTRGFTANTTHHRYHPSMKPQEYQFFPTPPVVDGSLERTMDLLSLMDQPRSLVSNQEIPKPKENDLNQVVSGKDASTRLDVEDMDLDLKL